MFAVLSPLRKALRPVAALATVALLSACDPSMVPGLGGANAALSGPQVDPRAPVKIALLVPKSDSGAAPVARSLENAVRLAMAEAQGAQIQLAVYDTAGNAATAQAQAQRAVDEGAKIILGPLFGEAANAAGVAVVDEGINVVSFSNNPSIAGGNVFVLGPTFANTANRLMGYARRKGKDSVVIVHSDDVPGQFGKVAVELAASSNGMRVVSSEPYALSIEGVNATAKRAGAAVQAGADSVVITTDASNAAMPMLLNLLPENGMKPGQIQFMGLTRWDVRPDLFNLPGAQGAWFTMPDQNRQNAFEARYKAAYSSNPHPLAGLGYDAVAAVAQLLQQGRRDALTGKALTRSNGFQGASGSFRLNADGTNSRALSIATVQNGKLSIIDPAPATLGGAGS